MLDMKIKGVESHDVTVDIDPFEMIECLKREWLTLAVGHNDAYPREGRWYHNFYAAFPDWGEPGDGIREIKYGEEEIYDGLSQLKYFYEKKVNDDYEKKRALEAKYGEDDV